MPRPVSVVKAGNIKESGAQTEGMIRQNAIVELSDKICSSVMIAKPHSASAVHHHGELDTIVYAAKGHGTIVSEGGSKRQQLNPGDHAIIPAYAEHQEANDSDEEVVWIIVRSGIRPIVENLEGWGKS